MEEVKNSIGQRGQGKKGKRQDVIEQLEMKKAIRYRLAQNKLLNFIQYTNPEYEVNWHHEYICNKIDAWFDGTGPAKLIINVPPQHGKSEISSRALPAYLMGRNPKSKIGIASYSSDLSMSFNRNVQEFMRKPEYQELFPQSVLPMQKEMGAKITQHEFVMPQGGYCLSTSVKGSLTGRSLDFGIVDDCYKSREEANSPVVSESTWEWFNSVFMSRFKDSGRILLLFTRWSQDDIAGRLLTEYPDQWELIRIPALSDTDYVANVDGHKPPEDPRTEVDEALWPKWHGSAKLKQVREQAPLSFSCLYQQQPNNGQGNIVKRDWFQVMQWGEFQLPNVQWDFFCDPAYTTKTMNDPSAIGAFGYDGTYLYIRKIAVVRKELPDLVKFIDQFCEENGYSQKSRIYVEPKASGLSVIQAMNYQTNKNIVQFKFPKINGARTGTLDKVTRVHSVTGKLEADRVKIIDGHWRESFLNEVCSFPNILRDDQTDILCFAVMQYFYKKVARGPRYA